MSTETRSLETQASPQTIWQLWSDPTTWAEWNPDVESAALNGPMAAGATGTMRTKSGGAHDIEITAVDPARSFVLETSPIPLTRFRFGCEVVPRAAGGSTISQSLTLAGPLAPLFSLLMAKRIADTFPALLRGLSAAAERSP
jgi:hypothetical protein